MINLIFLLSSLYIFNNIYISKFNSGNDERVNYFSDLFNKDHDSERIIKLYEDKIKLDYLQCTTISNTTKIETLEKEKSPLVFDLFAGGLLNDWDFEFTIE